MSDTPSIPPAGGAPAPDPLIPDVPIITDLPPNMPAGLPQADGTPKWALTQGQIEFLRDSVFSVWPAAKKYWPIVVLIAASFGVVGRMTAPAPAPVDPTKIDKPADKILEKTVPEIPAKKAGQDAKVSGSTDGPKVDIPDTLAASVGRYVSMDLKTNCKDVVWQILAPIGADGKALEYDLVREFTDPSVYRLRMQFYGPGLFHLVVAGAQGDKVASGHCAITVGDVAIVPGDSVSTKDFSKLKADVAALTTTMSAISDAVNKLIKTQPLAPPTPTDAFTKSVQDAYATDPDPAKAAHAATLVGIYRNSQTIVQKTTLKNASEILAAMKADEQAKLGATAILNVRKAVESELNWSLGTNEVPLTDKARSQISQQFARVQAALEALR